ncbi:nSTAND1 domain-containing NTPase [Streptomyces sp. enrichment culture]|uniref:nSTAND1 domain-containing NTPase n=1 Tax=Streptomyces sp. enrichment culture TaxID=1795815 RepID=UPI003F547822
MQRFAYELRKLRQEAGGPTYREMARRAHYSVTALSQAAAGEQLPSLAVALAYVTACGGDLEEWERRWREASEECAARDAEADAGQSPYQGLARFEPDDHDRFFGRDELVAEVRRMTAEHRFSAVFGPSGSGKSSLLRAGLIPVLRELGSGRVAAIRILTPGEQPLRTHEAALQAKDADGDTVIVVDQFEELFTLCRDPAQRAGFADRLLAAREPDSRLRVVIAVRADFYGRLAEHRALAAAVSASSLLVGPMSAAELREVIVKPARQAGLIVERELTARLVREVEGEPGALPLLSHVLHETWRRRRGRALTLQAYEAAGGLHGAIAQTAENVYVSLTPEHAEVARHILLRLVTPGEGAQDTRHPASRAELDFAPENVVDAVLDRLVSARLLTLDDETVDLAHEALITAWPRLGSWIDEARERLLVHRRLTEAAHTWDALGREPGALYRGTRLAAASEQLTQDALTFLERDFLTASRAASASAVRRRRGVLAAVAVLVVLALVAGVTAWQQSLTSERRHVEAEARRIAAVADAMRSADPATAMRLSVAAWRLAPTSESRSALLSAMAQPEQDVFPIPAPQSGRALNRLTPDGRALLTVSERRVVVRDMRTHRRIGSYPGPGSLLSETDLDVGMDPNWDVSPDGRMLALPAEGGVRLWDVRAGRVSAVLPADTAVSARFGADGHHLTVADWDREESQQVQVWDLRSRQRLVSVRAPIPEEPPTSISADGSTLALCRGVHRLEIRDLRTGRIRQLPWTDRAAPVACPDQDRYPAGMFALSPRGDVLAVVAPGGAIRRWAVNAGRELPRLNLEETAALRFSADGDFLAATSGTEIVLWRQSQPGRPVFRYRLIGEMSVRFALTPDAGALRYVRWSGTSVTTLDLRPFTRADWQRYAADRTLLTRDGRTAAVILRATGRTGVRLIDTRSGRTLAALPDRPCPPADSSSAPGTTDGSSASGPVDEASAPPGADPSDCSELMAFSRDGRRLAYVRVWGYPGSRQRITVWDIAAHRRVASLDAGRAIDSEVTGVAFGADGRSLLLTRSSDTSTLERWNLSTGTRTSTRPGPSGAILDTRPDDDLLVSSDNEVAELRTRRVRPLMLSDSDILFAGTFSDDGTRFAVGDITGRVTVWDGDLRHRLGVINGAYTGERETEQQAVVALAFSPDGRTLAVAGASGSVQLWDVASGRRLGSQLPASGQDVHALAFSEDGGSLYISGTRVPVDRIDLEPARLVRRVCARLGSGLSRSDWQTYLPDVSYRKTC